MILSENRADILTEAMNLGMGRAANALNQMVGTHIQLRVPSVSMLTPQEAKQRIEALGWIPLSTVQLEFGGSLGGNAALMFPSDSAVKLVALLTGDEGVHPDVDGLREATLEETGNILLNGVMGAISNMLDDQLTFSVPYYSESDQVIDRLTVSQDKEARIIFSRAHFNVAEYKIEGEILLCFEVTSLEVLLNALDQQISVSG